MWALPLASARWTWTMATSGWSAGTTTTSCPLKGIDHPPEIGVGVFQVAGGSRVHGYKRQAGRPGLQAGDHAEVGIFFPFQTAGFQLAAHDAQRADARIAHIGKDDLAGAAGRHHLIVDQVGGGAGQHQVFAPLADDLMPGGKRDQMGKPGRINAVTVVDVATNCFGKRTSLVM